MLLCYTVIARTPLVIFSYVYTDFLVMLKAQISSRAQQLRFYASRCRVIMLIRYDLYLLVIISHHHTYKPSFALIQSLQVSIQALQQSTTLVLRDSWRRRGSAYFKTLKISLCTFLCG